MGIEILLFQILKMRKGKMNEDTLWGLVLWKFHTRAFIFVKQSVWPKMGCVHINRAAMREEASCTGRMFSPGGYDEASSCLRDVCSTWKGQVYTRRDLKVM